ncbi:MAG TPA: MBL fold metallo-hydrolase [Candidatus Xenobia bacterium]
MLVRFLGHSSFLVSSTKGSTVVLDPFGSNIPYTFPQVQADVVVISHEHRDHNAFHRVTGTPVVVKRTTDFIIEHEIPVKRTGETLTFSGIPCFHDNVNGRRHGPNTMWHWWMEGIHMVHLGDLGHLLSDPQIKLLDKVHVLFLPVGGGSVLTPTEAALVVNQLNPHMVFPMHFKTSAIEFHGLASDPLESFLTRMDNVEELHSMAYEFELARLPYRTKIMVLDFE